jgi:hypothetical protein
VSVANSLFCALALRRQRYLSPNRRGQRIVRSLINSKRLSKRLSKAYDLTSVRIRQPYSNSSASGADI